MPCELRSESALFGRFLSGHFWPVLYSLGSGWAVFGRFCQHADRSCFAKKKSTHVGSDSNFGSFCTHIDQQATNSPILLVLQLVSAFAVTLVILTTSSNGALHI